MDLHLKLLYANDQRGRHAPSWYQAESTMPERDRLERQADADVCVIGAGYTGLSAALELARCGHRTIVLDAHRVGWGASGRNGGQLGTAFNKNQQQLEQMLGQSNARALWDIAEDAKTHIRQVCARHGIDIDYRPGIVHAVHRPGGVSAAHDYCAWLARHYGYQDLQPLSDTEIRQRVDSDDYHGGVIDRGAGHIHPLKLVLGLATAAEAAGTVIYEQSEALRVEPGHAGSRLRVVTPCASVCCDKVVYATNGYLDNLYPPLNRWVMPINNFIVVTERLGERAAALLPHDDAVADSRFVVNYFRRVDSDRLLFGGGENYSYRFPASIGSSVRRAMLGVFPQLQDVRIDYAWGGTLAITRNRLPHLQQPGADTYFAGGYSGHGVALAVICGTAIAEHIDRRPERFEQLSGLPRLAFPGGARARPGLLALAMTGYSWLDRI